MEPHPSLNVCQSPLFVDRAKEGWWRLFRRQALAAQSFATPEEITLATTVATCQLNARARPWVWGRPPPFPRHRRRVLTYRI